MSRFFSNDLYKYSNYTCIIRMKIECGCHCIKCKSTDLESNKIGHVEKDGYFDMHHTCNQCKTHFDHLDGEIFSNCEKCDYSSN